MRILLVHAMTAAIAPPPGAAVELLRDRIR
jgi:hypothetical protein